MYPQPAANLSTLLQAPVAVLGAGRSGRAACALVTALGGRSVLYDERSAEHPRFDAAAASGHRLTVFSPGFASDHPWLALAAQAGSELLTETDLGYLHWRRPLLAITGTNGKSTLTELLTLALRTCGKRAHSTGNHGLPLSQLVIDESSADAIAVCEISSFQAEMLRFLEADATLWTNFAEDHLDRHPSLEVYFRAKHRLVGRTRGNSLWHGPTVSAFASKLGITLPGQCVPTDSALPDPGVEGSQFSSLPQRENYLLTRAYWLSQGLPLADLIRAACELPRGKHRIALCGSPKGVHCFNDSKGTNFHAVLGALATFHKPPHWIGGGKDKGGDLAGFAEGLASRIASATLIGQTGPALARHLRAAAPTLPVAEAADLGRAVHHALALAKPGEALLFSPGFSSFDQFRSYEDRGDQFETLIAERISAGSNSPFQTQLSAQLNSGNSP